MGQTLFEDQFYSLVSEDSGLVLLTRTDVRANQIADLERSLVGLQTSLDAHVGGGTLPAILVDMRAARPRNDEAFEAVARRFRASIHARFDRVAVLVETKAGQLQVRRLDREQRVDTRQHAVFDEETQARAFLASAGLIAEP